MQKDKKRSHMEYSYDNKEYSLTNIHPGIFVKGIFILIYEKSLFGQTIELTSK